MTMDNPGAFVVYVPSFDFGSDAILLLSDYYTIAWLVDQFLRLSTSPIGSVASFVIGDGSPIDSEERCFVTVTVTDTDSSSEMTRRSATQFAWRISRPEAERYRALLSCMLTKVPSHNYLEPKNSPPAPVLVVSRDEYSVEQFRTSKT